MSVIILLTVLFFWFTASSSVQKYLKWNNSQLRFRESRALQIGPLGALPPTPEMIAEVGYKEVVYGEDEAIPEEFDARDKWPNCISLKTIWNQGTCGSCWAVSSASAMGDRYCIRNEENVMLSAYDVMSCCKDCCGPNLCEGGYPIRAWQFWNTRGVVTGGPTECPGCLCYRYTGDSLFDCDHRCRPDYGKLYDSDLTRGYKAKFLRNNVEQIQREIMRNGPVVATFEVFSDFGNSGKNVYIHRSGNFEGYHAVRVIGWGVQNVSCRRVPYWLMANSWGTQWGDGGLFRIIRGYNECRFESTMMAD